MRKEKNMAKTCGLKIGKVSLNKTKISTIRQRLINAFKIKIPVQ